MGTFDKSLDAELFKETVEIGEAKLNVGLYSYNGGTKKIQISRQRKAEEGSEYPWKFAKLGRMTVEEADAILPLIEKATRSA